MSRLARRRAALGFDLRLLGITAAGFVPNVTTVDLSHGTRMTEKQGVVLWLENVDGTGANRITQSDFLLA